MARRYFDRDEFGAPRPTAHTAAPGRRGRPRDGDGDGFVFDGTPRMRPFNPLTDVRGKMVKPEVIARAARGSRPDQQAVRDRTRANIKVYRKVGDRLDADRLIESTLGERPTSSDRRLPEYRAVERLVRDELRRAQTSYRPRRQQESVLDEARRQAEALSQPGADRPRPPRTFVDPEELRRLAADFTPVDRPMLRDESPGRDYVERLPTPGTPPGPRREVRRDRAPAGPGWRNGPPSNEQVAAAFTTDLGDGYTTEVDEVVPGYVKGRIVVGGETVGTFSRSISQSQPVAEFETLNLHRDHVGRGLGNRFFAQSIENLRALGVERVDVFATSHQGTGDPGYNGAYTWARAGYDWGSQTTRHLRLADQLDRVADRGLGSPADQAAAREMAARLRALPEIPANPADIPDDFPTPNDVAMLGWTGGDGSWFGRDFLSGLALPGARVNWTGSYHLTDKPAVDLPPARDPEQQSLFDMPDSPGSGDVSTASPDAVRDAAKAAGASRVRARVADRSLSAAGVKRGDVVDVEYGSDVHARVAVTRRGRTRVYTTPWSTFDAVDQSVATAPAEPRRDGQPSLFDAPAPDVPAAPDVPEPVDVTPEPPPAPPDVPEPPTAPVSGVQRVVDAVRALGVELDLVEKDSPEGPYLELGRIVVPEDRRNEGLGGQAMALVTQYADETGADLFLTPSADFGGTKSRLERWYRSLGFKPNKGRSKDFRSRETMVRTAQPVEAPAPIDEPVDVTPEVPEAPEATPDLDPTFADIAPDGKLYRAYVSGERDRYSSDGAQGAIYWTGVRSYAENYGDDIDEIDLPPLDDIADVRDPASAQQMIDWSAAKIDELDALLPDIGEPGYTREGRTSIRDAREALGLADANDPRSVGRVLATVGGALNQVENPDDPWRSGTGEKRMMDELGWPVIVAVEAVEDAGRPEAFSFAFREMPDVPDRTPEAPAPDPDLARELGQRLLGSIQPSEAISDPYPAITRALVDAPMNDRPLFKGSSYNELPEVGGTVNLGHAVSATDDESAAMQFVWETGQGAPVLFELPEGSAHSLFVADHVDPSDPDVKAMLEQQREHMIGAGEYPVVSVERVERDGYSPDGDHYFRVRLGQVGTAPPVTETTPEPVDVPDLDPNDVRGAALKGRVSARVADRGLTPLGIKPGDQVDVEYFDEDQARVFWRTRSGAVRSREVSWDRLGGPVGEPEGLQETIDEPPATPDVPEAPDVTPEPDIPEAPAADPDPTPDLAPPEPVELDPESLPAKLRDKARDADGAVPGRIADDSLTHFGFKRGNNVYVEYVDENTALVGKKNGSGKRREVPWSALTTPKQRERAVQGTIADRAARIAEQHDVDQAVAEQAIRDLAGLKASSKADMDAAADDALAALDSANATYLSPPPPKVWGLLAEGGEGWLNPAGGEWDWFYALSPREQARLRRNWFTGTTSPDEAAGYIGDEVGTTGTAEAMAWWLERTRIVDANAAIRRGRMPAHADQVDLDGLMVSLHDEQVSAYDIWSRSPDEAAAVLAVTRARIDAADREEWALRALGPVVDGPEGERPWELGRDEWTERVSALEYRIENEADVSGAELDDYDFLAPPDLRDGGDLDDVYDRIRDAARDAGFDVPRDSTRPAPAYEGPMPDVETGPAAVPPPVDVDAPEVDAPEPPPDLPEPEVPPGQDPALAERAEMLADPAVMAANLRNESVGGMFAQLSMPRTLSGTKLHVRADDVDETAAALEAVADVIEARGLGAKVAGHRFHTAVAGSGQAGKGLTIYLPERATVDDDTAAIADALRAAGYRPGVSDPIAGDDTIDADIGLYGRYELRDGAPDRDLGVDEYRDWYQEAPAPDSGTVVDESPGTPPNPLDELGVMPDDVNSPEFAAWQAGIVQALKKDENGHLSPEAQRWEPELRSAAASGMIAQGMAVYDTDPSRAERLQKMAGEQMQLANGIRSFRDRVVAVETVSDRPAAQPTAVPDDVDDMPYDLEFHPANLTVGRRGGGLATDSITPDTIDRMTEAWQEAPEQMRLRVPTTAIAGIVADGRVKTQFETGTSGGGLHGQDRKNTENDAMGVPADIPDARRPVYGYAGDPAGTKATAGYGDIVLRVKPKVAGRTTLMFGDSLGTQGAALPLTERDVTPDRLMSAFEGGWRRGDAALEGDVGGGFTELQFHGGLTLDDLEDELEFTPRQVLGSSSGFDPAALDQLGAAIGDGSKFTSVRFQMPVDQAGLDGPALDHYRLQAQKFANANPAVDVWFPDGSGGHERLTPETSTRRALDPEAFSRATEAGKSDAIDGDDDLLGDIPDGPVESADPDYEDYRMAHQPSYGPGAYNLLDGDMLPGDAYDRPRLYAPSANGNPEWLDETTRQLEAVRGDRNATVTVYRSVPPDVAARGDVAWDNGNWVSLSRGYADNHGHTNGSDDWVTIERQVPAWQVRFAGDDLMEWGWFPDGDPDGSWVADWGGTPEPVDGDAATPPGGAVVAAMPDPIVDLAMPPGA